MQHANRRQSPRHSVSLDVTLHAGGLGSSVRGASADLSSNGMFVLAPVSVPEGRRVDLVIYAGRRAPVVATSGIVVHSLRGVGIGVKFSHASHLGRHRIQALLAALFDQKTEVTPPPPPLAAQAEAESSSAVKEGRAPTRRS